MNNPDKIALTQSQLAIWMGQKLDPNAPLYNMAHTFEIAAAIDEGIFQDAFNKLVQQVDALRTVFGEEDGIPYQKICKDIPDTSEVITMNIDTTPAQIDQWIINRTQCIFDITTKLFDCVLIKLNEHKYIWFLNVHHLITDATSSTILYEYFKTLYKSLAEGNTATIGIPAYKDYVDYEHNMQSHKKAVGAKEYWETVASDATPLKIYGQVPQEPTTKSRRLTVPLGNQRTQKLKAAAKDPDFFYFTEDLTLFTLSATLLYSYLYRVSPKKEDFIIGAPAHNRANAAHKKTPGLFVEVYPLKVSISDEDSFLSLYNKVKLATNDYFKNIFPGATTVAANRSYNVVLNYINAHFSDFNGAATHSEWVHPGHCDPSHYLRCHVYDMDALGEITLLFDLNEAVFNRELQDDVPSHFLHIVDALLEDIEQPINKPSITGNPNDFVYRGAINPETPLSVTSLIESQVKQQGSAIALEYKEVQYTYAMLQEQVDRLASYLQDNAIASNDKVAVLLERTPEYITSILAILKIGATFIPIPAGLPSQRIAYILQDAECNLLITDSQLQEQAPTAISKLLLDQAKNKLSGYSISVRETAFDDDAIAYMIYTSGSTGNPKGVAIPHKALNNYLHWAKNEYSSNAPLVFPLFTSIGFDLTITSTFLPLLTGGSLIIYKENIQGPDLSLMEVIHENKVNSIKLTPSHLTLIQGMDVSQSTIETMIVGGEDFKTQLAKHTQGAFGRDLAIYNEYGPTEATVGCIVAKFNSAATMASVPIGTPITNMSAYILDEYLNPVPTGVLGELYLGGVGLAQGYTNLPELTNEKFISNPFSFGDTLYRTGDLVRANTQKQLEYHGRIDEQVKLRGHRIELADIEANMANVNAIDDVAVVVVGKEAQNANEVTNCAECGLPSNFPNTDFDDQGVCHICNAFRGYKTQAQRYFKTEDQLKELLISKRGQGPHYDCLSLLSGGKDSTYILARLMEMGLKVLAFTLDNGYISDQAKQNIDKIVKKLGVDHFYGTTEHMNAIFVDSLHRHHNVCNGCFKTIYTLSTQIALKKQIPFIVTGLSRGQFFETRLTEELFWDEQVDIQTIDDTILQARKLYHQEDDAVRSLLDVEAFNNDETFSKVQFVDFYRYSDVRLDEMLRYLKEQVDWVRPTDTGRSTNCLINQVGIYVHKKYKGYSNYAFPYSWDVRMGHKTRTETLEEINETIYEDEVKRIMEEIGYDEPGETALQQQYLVGYYTGKDKVPNQKLYAHLTQNLPDYMIPSHFKYVENLPLTPNGKVDKTSLRNLTLMQLEMETPFVQPEGEIEEIVASVWQEVLRIKQVGRDDSFIQLGGHSLAAIRVTVRLSEEFALQLQLNKVFEFPTVKTYAAFVEETLIELLEAQES